MKSIPEAVRKVPPAIAALPPWLSYDEIPRVDELFPEGTTSGGFVSAQTYMPQGKGATPRYVLSAFAAVTVRFRLCQGVWAHMCVCGAGCTSTALPQDKSLRPVCARWSTREQTMPADLCKSIRRTCPNKKCVREYTKLNIYVPSNH